MVSCAIVRILLLLPWEHHRVVLAVLAQCPAQPLLVAPVIATLVAARDLPSLSALTPLGNSCRRH